MKEEAKKSVEKFIKKSNEKKFIKYLTGAFYLFVLFIILTFFQFLFNAIIPDFIDTACWSLFISLRLLVCLLATGSVFIFFFYLVLYALKD